MANVVEIDDREITITPIFQHMEIENIPKSETAGHAVMEMREVVKVHFAGSKNYSPIFPAHAFSHRKGNQIITYAERWSEQYRAFKAGDAQEANGTPLEMLRGYGLTPEQISLCRALKIFSIEALYHLEGAGVKALGVHSNTLKGAARSFMADRSAKGSQFGEIEALRARIAELENPSTVPPEVEAGPVEIVDALTAADASVADDDALVYEMMSDSELKEEIAKLAGRKPAGNPTRDTLLSALKNLKDG